MITAVTKHAMFYFICSSQSRTKMKLVRWCHVYHEPIKLAGNRHPRETSMSATPHHPAGVSKHTLLPARPPSPACLLMLLFQLV